MAYNRAEDNDPLGALERYATTPNPEKLSIAIHFSHTDATITVFDQYPKSKIHFLILPRPRENVVTVPELLNLRTLMRDKDKAKRTLLELGAAAEKLVPEIEAEMVKHWGFKWPLWIGFHALPSMRHVHLHVLSADLCSDRVKIKKHYNTFHPKLGFFLHYKDVMDWFDATPSYYEMMSEFRISMYKPFLDEDLTCFKCYEEFRTMPRLKKHLDDEWEAAKARELAKAVREKERLEKKRKREEKKRAAAESATSTQTTATLGTSQEAESSSGAAAPPPHKKQETHMEDDDDEIQIIEKPAE